METMTLGPSLWPSPALRTAGPCSRHLSCLGCPSANPRPSLACIPARMGVGTPQHGWRQVLFPLLCEALPQRPLSACAASQGRCQVPGATGSGDRKGGGRPRPGKCPEGLPNTTHHTAAAWSKTSLKMDSFLGKRKVAKPIQDAAGTVELNPGRNRSCHR